MNCTVTEPTTEGKRRMDAAHRLLETRRRRYVNRGRRALLTRLLSHGQATADDVQEAVTLPPEINPVCLGVVPRQLVTAGIIECAGFTRTKRPKAHYRPVNVWRLVDRAKAIAWLESNPDRPDPEHSEDNATVLPPAANN